MNALPPELGELICRYLHARDVREYERAVYRQLVPDIRAWACCYSSYNYRYLHNTHECLMCYRHCDKNRVLNYARAGIYQVIRECFKFWGGFKRAYCTPLVEVNLKIIMTNARDKCTLRNGIKAALAADKTLAGKIVSLFISKEAAAANFYALTLEEFCDACSDLDFLQAERITSAMTRQQKRMMSRPIARLVAKLARRASPHYVRRLQELAAKSPPESWLPRELLAQGLSGGAPQV